jgi:regulator of sirC expression with transglutaminase-like and TPR domain
VDNRAEQRVKPKIEIERGAKELLLPGPIAPANRTRLAALASLLADDSPSVLVEVRRALEASGPASRTALERAARSDDARVRARARAILHERAQREALRRVARYASRADVDLERALFLLARIHAPGLDPRPYRRALDAMAAEVAQRAAKAKGDLERALVLSEYLGGELAFGGSRGEFHHPDNVHLHRAIERRTGVPLTLSAIWVFVGRRAGIRASFVPLPGHVMVRLFGGWRSAIVDPYHQGKTRTEAECKAYLEKHGIRVTPGSFREAPDAALLRRQIGNLSRSAELRGLAGEVRLWSSLLAALDPGRARGELTA